MHLYNTRPATSTTLPRRLEHSRRWGPTHPHNNGNGTTGSDSTEPATRRVVPRRYLKPRVKAGLAREILRSHWAELTTPQIARAFNIPAKFVHAVRPAAGDQLVTAWQAAGPLDRIRFAQRIGVANLWDDAIAPALD